MAAPAPDHRTPGSFYSGGPTMIAASYVAEAFNYLCVFVAIGVGVAVWFAVGLKFRNWQRRNRD
jgi:hypothetical protein